MRTTPARSRLLFAAALVVTLIAAALLVATANADLSRPATATLGTDGTSGTSFSSPNALAFDQSSKTLYVLEQGSSEIHAFDASTPGSFTPAGGNFPLSVSGAGGVDDLAVNSSSHDFYFFSDSNNSVSGFDSTGTALGGGFPAPSPNGDDSCGGAVDPSGNIWLADYPAQAVFEYDSSGNPVMSGGNQVSVDTSDQGHPCNAAFDSAGNIYVALYHDAVWRYTAASGYDKSSATEIDPTPSPDGARALTVDRSTDTLYVAHPDHLSAWDSSANHLYDFGGGVSGAAYTGVAVNQSTDQVYAADSGNGTVHVFGPAVNPPDVTTNPATGVAKHAATLNGHLDPSTGGDVSDCHFEYLSDADFSANGNSYSGPHTPATIPCDQATPISSATDVTATPSGLDAGTTYHFRLVAANAQASADGTDQTFATDPAVVLTIATADPVGATTATVHGHVDSAGGGDITDCHFEYLDDAAFQANTPADPFAGAQSAPCSPATPISAPTDVSADLSGLRPGTTYHVRLLATNSDGTSQTGDQLFATQPLPLITAEGLGSVGISDATLTATINPKGQATYHLDYGTAGPCSSNPCQSTAESAPIGFPGDDSPHQVTVQISGLTAGTTYHFRFVATNANGPAQGADRSFATHGPPVILGQHSGAVGSTEVDLAGFINPEGSHTNYHWQYGSQGPCSSNPCSSFPVPDADLGSANPPFTQVSTFAGQDTSAGGFTGLGRIAIHDSTGTLYAIDHHSGNHDVVDRFDASGQAQDFPALGHSSLTGADVTAPDGPVGFGLGNDSDLAVDNSGTASDGRLYVLQELGDNSHTAFAFAPDGTYLHKIDTGGGTDACGIAVDSHGNVWIADYASERLLEYDAAGNPVDSSPGHQVSIDTHLQGNPCHFAIGPDDDFYVAIFNGPVEHYDSSGAFQGEIDSTAPPDGARAVTVDPLSGHVFVVRPGRLSEYDASGTPVSDFDLPSGTVLGGHAGGLGAAVNPASGDLYVSDVFDGLVHRFGHYLPADQRLSGLQPDTTYHFRLVAQSAAGTTAGPDQSLTTQAGCANDSLRTGPGAFLPDCRAYEQASPVDKHGSTIQPFRSLVQASPAGDRLSFADIGGLPTTGGSSSISAYVASREATGWTTDGLLAPASSGFSALLMGWSDDLDASLSQVQSNSGPHLYLGDTAAGTWQQASPAGTGANNLAAFAADHSHLIFESSPDALTPDAIPNQDNLYNLDHGALTLAGRIPPGSAISCDDSTHAPDCTPAPAGSFAGSYDWAGANSAGTPLGHGGASDSYYTQNTISADGSRVFFTEGGTGRLFMRANGTRTVQVNASQASSPDPNGPQPAAWLASTPSGSKVFFASCERLTDDSTAASTAANTCTDTSGHQDHQGSDLYSYDTASAQLADLTPDSNGDPLGADLQGLLGATPDGSYVYFVANGVLASNAGADGDHASLGDCSGHSDSARGTCNLYLAHAGVTTFIARLSTGPSGSSDPNSDHTDWQPFFTKASPNNSRVAADGTLLFSSTQRLAGYDSQGKAELYRYRPGDAAPTCVSCDPSGVPPIGPAELKSKIEVGVLPPIVGKPVLTRNISADGNRIFFDSPDPLVPADVNGDHGCPVAQLGRSCLDAYEWEADGTGSCQTNSQNDGCLYLLSTGRSPEPSLLGDVSASGDDAFIFTAEPLVPQDTDHLYDAYDVRVGGGLASQHQTQPAPCSGDSCQGPSTPPPTDQGSGSSAFSGPGNQGHNRSGSTPTTPKKCKKHHKHRCRKKSRQAENARRRAK